MTTGRRCKGKDTKKTGKAYFKPYPNRFPTETKLSVETRSYNTAQTDICQQCAESCRHIGCQAACHAVSRYIRTLRQMYGSLAAGGISLSSIGMKNLRSKAAIRTSATRYFADPSIAAAAMGIGPKDLLNDLNSFGLLFETLVVRDLRVYADALDGQVYHYRDNNGLECDAVVHLRNGSYGLVEIKLGGEKLVEEGAKTLKRLSSKIDTTRMKEPSFLMVITAVGAYAYQREDRVFVVPICCLKD